jgi:hypothetical protein
MHRPHLPPDHLDTGDDLSVMADDMSLRIAPHALYCAQVMGMLLQRQGDKRARITGAGQNIHEMINRMNT